tara:strand:+ start:12774 stop:15365 length:2592 start_codon:yes stop_codon:yes gene_type:complete
MPQTEAAKAEIQELMMVSKNIVSPQSNKPVIGIVQDSLLASRKITTRNVFLTKKEVMNILFRINKNELPMPSILKPEPLWTGKQIIESLFPSNFSFERKSGWHDPNDKDYIGDTDVIIKNGTYISGTLCKKSLGTSEGGLIHTIWLEYGPLETCNFISNLQYIVNLWVLHHGFTVGLGDTVTDKKVQIQVQEAINNATEKVDQLIALSKNNNINDSLLEQKLNQELNNAMANSGRCVQNGINKENNISQMVSGGSKGSIINIAQIMGCVGQQNVGGKRVSMGYEGRVTPHFEKNDISSAAKGFVRTSYFKGLAPHEFFYHAMGGREGIIDTAVKTSETGYIQRRLIKSMEDLRISFDRSVRNSVGDMVQLIYGEDGYDSTFLLTHNVGKTKVRSPIYIDRLIDNFHPSDNPVPLEYLDEKIVSLFKNECESVQILINDRRERLSMLSQENIDNIFLILGNQLRRAYIKQGEMVGTLSAQSIGEPTTQLALNSFHFSGISAKTMTLGVPRFKEIINDAKNIKSPSMTLPLLTKDREEVDKIACSLEYTLLKSIVSKFEIIPTIDTEYSKVYESFGTVNIPYEYMIRFTIDKKKLMDKRTSTYYASAAIMKEYYESLYITTSYENNPDIYLDARVYDADYNIDILKQLAIKLENTIVIHGNQSIDSTYITENNGDFIIETDGSCLEEILGRTDIDSTRTITNNSSEVLEVLGIEAARASLMNEIRQVIEYDGGYVNYRHFSMLVDTMTCKGQIMSITRHGINKTNTGPLMKCSFEETVDVLLDAAQFGELDKLQGVTETITMGKLSKIGTGNMKMIWNPSVSPLAEEVVEYYEDEFIPATPPCEEEWETSVMFTENDLEESYFPW